MNLHLCVCVCVWLGVRFHTVGSQESRTGLNFWGGEFALFLCARGWKSDSKQLEIRKAVRGLASGGVSLHCFCVRVWLGLRFHAIGKQYGAKLLGE